MSSSNSDIMSNPTLVKGFSTAAFTYAIESYMNPKANDLMMFSAVSGAGSMVGDFALSYMPSFTTGGVSSPILSTGIEIGLGAGSAWALMKFSNSTQSNTGFTSTRLGTLVAANLAGNLFTNWMLGSSASVFTYTA